MPSKNHKRPYDANLIVIGAGSAGLVSAYIAAVLKAKVILIEKNEMGGDCLNTGCVPSKALIRSARFLYQLSRAREYGIHAVAAEFEFAEIMERVQRVVSAVAPHDSTERFTGLGVEVIKGEARLRSPHSVVVNGKTLSANGIIIASGAKPVIPPIDGIGSVDCLTSDNIWTLRTLPPRLLVLGGGPIGCELAQCFARFGSRVIIVEMLPRIMIREDEEVSSLVTAQFEKEGVTLLTGHRAERFIRRNGENRLVCDLAGQKVEIAFDRLLIAVGRAANLEGYGLRELNVPVSQPRRIEVNAYLQAGYPTLYACGDVTGPYQFTHAASHQAWYATINALFGTLWKFRVDYSVLPWATFTDPEVARVGLNEQEAKIRNIGYEITCYDLADLDRAITDGEARGLIKVLTKPGKDEILGVTIAGEHAGDLLAEFVLAMRHGLGLNKILQTIHIYPTWVEANKYVAGNWKRAHAPAWALAALKRYHSWRRR